MEISIIIILYYSEHLIEKIVKNIEDKIHFSKEIIFINNSLNIIDYYHKNVQILYPNKNLGYGGAVNYGMRYARYDNILILNPDIIISSFHFNKNIIKNCILGGIDKELFKTNIFPPLFNDAMRITIRKLFIIRKLDFFFDIPKINITRNNITKVDFIHGALILLNKKTFELLNGFDENFFLFYEEIDFAQRANRIDVNRIISNRIVYTHSKKEKSSNISVNGIKEINEIRSFLLYHKKYSNIYFYKIIIIYLKIFYRIFIAIFHIGSLFNSTISIKRKNLFINYLKGLKEVK